MSLLVLCSCVAQAQAGRQLPAPVTINKEAGRGGHLIVTLTLENGKEVPFVVDTGAPATVLDESLEPELGKCLGQSSLNWWNGQEPSHTYAAPKLYLGGALLPTARQIFTSDLKRAKVHALGVLGMDCLRHYCVQLDFVADEMRFLASGRKNAAEFGRAFPLMFSAVGSQKKFILPTIHLGSLIGENADSIIDTGCSIDGLGSAKEIAGIAEFLPECVWQGETFTNLIVAAVDHANVLGLSFLARHLVTLDFPNRTMYLKQTSTGPLCGDIMLELTHSDQRTIFEAYESLRDKNQLPGLTKNDQGVVYLEASVEFESVRFRFRKTGGLSTCHYEVGRVNNESPWKLQKAWRTDAEEHVVEQYPVPWDNASPRAQLQPSSRPP